MDERISPEQEREFHKRDRFKPHPNCDCVECENFITGWNMGFAHGFNAADPDDEWPDLILDEQGRLAIPPGD